MSRVWLEQLSRYAGDGRQAPTELLVASLTLVWKQSWNLKQNVIIKHEESHTCPMLCICHCCHFSCTNISLHYISWLCYHFLGKPDDFLIIALFVIRIAMIMIMMMIIITIISILMIKVRVRKRLDQILATGFPYLQWQSVSRSTAKKITSHSPYSHYYTIGITPA